MGAQGLVKLVKNNVFFNDWFTYSNVFRSHLKNSLIEFSNFKFFSTVLPKWALSIWRTERSIDSARRSCCIYSTWFTVKRYMHSHRHHVSYHTLEGYSIANKLKTTHSHPYKCVIVLSHCMDRLHPRSDLPSQSDSFYHFQQTYSIHTAMVQRKQFQRFLIDSVL